MFSLVVLYRMHLDEVRYTAAVVCNKATLFRLQEAYFSFYVSHNDP